MTGFVYLWTNLINGKKYLGSHIGTPDDGYTGSGKLFLRAVEKYGIDKFSRVLLEDNIPDDTVRVREQVYLDQYNAALSKDFYNLSYEAGGGFKHINQSPKKAEYQAKALQGYYKRLEEKGHPRGMAGKTHTPEVREQMSKNIQTALVALKGRPVVCFDKEGNQIAEYESLQAAAKAVLGSPSNIKYTCEGRFKTAYGFKWAYA